LDQSLVTSDGVAALAHLPTLETLGLLLCRQIRDVSCLSESASLRELDLRGTKVDDAGIAGLERITLTSLELAGCDAVTNVTRLRQAPSLRFLDISHTSVTSDGVAGIEWAPALEFVRMLTPDYQTIDRSGIARRMAKRAVKTYVYRWQCT
jgi:hypothetical protein